MEVNKLKIKVCGMRDESNITQLLNHIQIDFMGLIFYQKSSRYVSQKLSDAILDKIKNKFKIQLAGVFVEQTLAEILTIAKQYQLDLIQLHGREHQDIQFCQRLKAEGYKIIKTFAVDLSGQDNLNKQIDSFATSSSELKKSVDFFLFDTKSSQYGGLGKSFDWNLLPNQIPIPYFLSGGVSDEQLENIKTFMKQRKEKKQSLPYGLDLNSRFEIKPALKDIQKIKSFLNQLIN